MKLDRMLCEEVQSELTALKDMEMGTEEHKIAVDCITKLADRAIELEKIDIEHQDKIESQDFENGLKLKQMEAERKNRLIQNILTAAGIVLPVGLTVWGTFKSFEFEKEGTITTIFGRGFMNKFFTKK